MQHTKTKHASASHASSQRSSSNIANEDSDNKVGNCGKDSVTRDSECPESFVSLVASFSSAFRASARAPLALCALRNEGKLVWANKLNSDLQFHSAHLSLS